MSMMMEENVDECHQGLEFHESPVSRTEAAEDHKSHTINFSFSCNPVYIYTITHQHNGCAEFVDYEELPTVTKSLRVELQDINNWEEVREKLERLLEDYPMSYPMRQELMDLSVDTATDILISSGHHVLYLHIPFDIMHEHIFEENNAMGIISSPDWVPASSISTQSLK